MWPKSWLRRKVQAMVDARVAELLDGRVAQAIEEHGLLMPKYQYHCPLDYQRESHPPFYEPAIRLAGVELPLPPPHLRGGYAPDDDTYYLEWGKNDHDRIIGMISKYGEHKPRMTILDWGCASGRVLRHFHAEHKELGWRLLGIDVQAYSIHWLRENFPKEFEVICGTTMPHLPYCDSSIDVIYGLSVFTHTKYLWDTWLTELKRVVKPGGLVIQTVQCERAWRFYYGQRDVDWVRERLPQSMLEQPELTEDFFLYGDGLISQTFFKEEVIRKYWGRIMEVVGFEAPSIGDQDWVICKLVPSPSGRGLG